jgi:hypothetical protein
MLLKSPGRQPRSVETLVDQVDGVTAYLTDTVEATDVGGSHDLDI